MVLLDTAVAILGLVALAATLVATLVVIGLHVLPGTVDPVCDGVSAYALGRWGPLYRIQVLASGLAASAIVLGGFLAGVGASVGLVALAAYAIARFAIVRFPTDPPGVRRLTQTGRIHALLASVAFVSIALAAPLLGLFGPGTGGPGTAPFLLRAVSVAVPVAVLATFAAGGEPRLRSVFGVVERTVYAGAFAWLGLVSLDLIVDALG